MSPSNAERIAGVVGAAASVATLLALACWNLGANSLWYDEAATSYATSVQGSRLVSWLSVDANMWLYYAVLRGFRSFLGSGEASLRIPSALAAAGSVILLVCLGRRWFGTRVGVIAGTVLALEPWTVRYAREARGYTLVMFACMLSVFFFDAIQHGRRRARLWWIVVSLAAVYVISSRCLSSRPK